MNRCDRSTWVLFFVMISAFVIAFLLYVVDEDADAAPLSEDAVRLTDDLQAQLTRAEQVTIMQQCWDDALSICRPAPFATYAETR